MTKWLALGVVGVLLLIAGAVLITSGISIEIGRIAGVGGGALVLLSVVIFPLAKRWSLFRMKGRAVVFGVGIVGRIIKILGVLLFVAIAAVVYMTYFSK